MARTASGRRRFGASQVAALVCLALCATALGCASSPLNGQPRDFLDMATRAGLRPFVFPRDVFQPGSIVKLDRDGNVTGSPAGSLAECSPEVSLTPQRGEGLTGGFLSAARQGLRLDVAIAQRLLPIRLGAAARSISYAMLTIPGSYALVHTRIAIETWVTEHWSQMLPACRSTLRAGDTAILTEVYYATKNTRLRFFRADGQELELSAQEIQDMARGGLSAYNARVDARSIVFDADLPLLYSTHRPALPAVGCPFSLAAVGEARYVDCVRALPEAERAQVLVEAARALRREFTATTGLPQPTFRREDFALSIALIKFLLAIDENNGHGLYYDGTLRRWLYKEDRTSEEFLRSNERYLRYLQIEDSLQAQERDGDAEACYTRARGYCAERTAWVLHVLANDLYRVALKETREDRRRAYFEQALRQADRALRIRPAGFDQLTQGVPTKELSKRLREALDAR